jgi:hypothetical protein
VQLCILSHFIICRTLLPFTLHCLLHFVVPHHTLLLLIVLRRSSSLLVVSSQILLGILFIYIFSLFSHLSHRLLKKGLTSPCSFHSFCRFIPLQVYHRIDATSVATVMTDVFQKNGIMVSRKLAKIVRIFVTPETRTLCVHHKTYTKPSTFVKYVIKFAHITNSIHILSLCGPHNHNWQA